MNTRRRPTTRPSWTPPWFLGRDSSLYVERYTPSVARLPDPAADDRPGPVAAAANAAVGPGRGGFRRSAMT